jgi:hypothetical protein
MINCLDWIVEHQSGFCSVRMSEVIPHTLQAATATAANVAITAFHSSNSNPNSNSSSSTTIKFWNLRIDDAECARASSVIVAQGKGQIGEIQMTHHCSCKHVAGFHRTKKKKKKGKKSMKRLGFVVDNSKLMHTQVNDKINQYYELNNKKINE